MKKIINIIIGSAGIVAAYIAMAFVIAKFINLIKYFM